MKVILSRLEAILDRLSHPHLLTAEEVGFLAREWDETMDLLERFPDGAAFRALSAGDKLFLRTWLQRLLRRLPTVLNRLVAQKSDIAQQLFSESRRLQAMNQRYFAEFRGTGTLHQKA